MSGDYQNIAGRVGSSQEVFLISRDGSGQEVFNLTGRVGSDWVGSGRVGSGRVGSGRVGSGQVRRYKCPRVGTGYGFP